MSRAVALLFPGQGSQEVGMGRDLLGRDPFADELISAASDAAGADLFRIATRGPARVLAETDKLQPALAAVCLALWRRFDEAGIPAVATAGHSLGELPALAAAGMVDPLSVVRLAAARGRAMGDAAALSPGGMIAVTGLPVDDVIRTIEPLRSRGAIGAAAVNAPTQLTVSGEPELLDELTRSLGGRDGAKVTPLRVSGAWHSEQMRPAVASFAAALDEIAVTPPTTPMIFNRTGREEGGPAEVRRLLAGQLVSPIRWDRVMGRLDEMGVTDFVEIGPGRVLRGLVRLNNPDPDVRVHNVSDTRSLARVVNTLTSP